MARARLRKRLTPEVESKLSEMNASLIRDSVNLRIRLRGLGEELLACSKGAEFSLGMMIDLNRWSAISTHFGSADKLVRLINATHIRMNELQHGQKS